jgi:hypothetical protein
MQNGFDNFNGSMEEEIPDDTDSVEDQLEQLDDIPEDMRSDAMAMLLSAGFRGLQSRANQL